MRTGPRPALCSTLLAALLRLAPAAAQTTAPATDATSATGAMRPTANTTATTTGATATTTGATTTGATATTTGATTTGADANGATSATTPASNAVPAALPVTEATQPVNIPASLRFPARTRDARRPYHLDVGLDLSVLLAGASLWVPPEYMLREFVPLGRCPCDPAQLNALDRRTAGVSVPGFGDASNAATVVLLALPAVFDMFDVWRSGGSLPEWIEDTIVLGESLVVGGALNEVTKLIFQRPRPQAYGIDPGDGRLGDPDTYLSFYSLSAAEVFTAGIAGAMTFALRHPRSPWRWVYLATAGVLATGFGVTRVLLGRHFPTDIFAAAGLGTLVGVVVPFLHQRPINVSLGAQIAPGAALITASMPLR